MNKIVKNIGTTLVLSYGQHSQRSRVFADAAFSFLDTKNGLFGTIPWQLVDCQTCQGRDSLEFIRKHKQILQHIEIEQISKKMPGACKFRISSLAAAGVE